MKTNAHGIGWSIKSVAAVAVTLYGLHNAVAASGGTIYFSGMIVAPPLDVSAKVVVPPHPSAGVALQEAASSSTVAVTFKVPPGGVSGVDVSLLVNDADAPRVGAAALDMLAARFSSADGHTVAPARDGHYRLGANGGVLSLSAPGSVPSASEPVTVVLRYN